MFVVRVYKVAVLYQFFRVCKPMAYFFLIGQVGGGEPPCFVLIVFIFWFLNV